METTFKVVVKHRGKKYDVDVDTSAPGKVFKYQVFSLTNVEPERQKIFIKGTKLADDTDMSKLGLKAGQVIMMMGTPADEGLIRPADAVKFVEDMTEAEAAKQAGAIPSGLKNMGNTCYMNATLQTLRSIPELQDALSKYEFTNSPSEPTQLAQIDVTHNLGQVFKQMSETQDAIQPFTFLNAFRIAYPQFAERAKNRIDFAQQDAEEAWSQLISQLQRRLTVPGADGGQSTSFVDKYMAGQFVSTLKCDDEAAAAAGEQPTVVREKFLKLNCHIDSQTNHLVDGIKNGLREQIEKKSEALDREATYTKTSQISRLPKYLTVHFVRFFWKREAQKKAKIMRKVTFPHELDATEYCTDELRKALVPVRDKLREVRKDEEDIDRARKRRKKNPLLAGDSAASNHDAGNNADAGGEPGEVFKTDAEFEAEKDAALLAAKKELYALVDEDLRKQDANQSGLYELRGVVTHQGASADSGHYTCYVKKTGVKDPQTGEVGDEDGKWWWFNDDTVTEVTADKIDTLAGGGESHSALILLYRALPMPTAKDLEQ